MQIDPNAPFEPLHNPDLEIAILGGFAVSSGAMSLAPNLKADHFFDPIMQTVFDTMRRKFDEGISFNFMQIAGELDRWADDLSPAEFMKALYQRGASKRDIPDMTDQLVDLAERREARAFLVKKAGELENTAKPFKETVSEIDSFIMEAADDTEDGDIISFKQAAEQAARNASDAASDEANGVKTGLADVDAKIGQMDDGKLIVIGGRPASGKTALALIIAKNVASKGHGVVISSLEMMAPDLVTRVCSDWMREKGMMTPYSDILKGDADGQSVHNFISEALDRRDTPIHIIPPHIRDISAICAGARRAKIKMEAAGVKMGCFVIDYLQLAEGPGHSRQEQIANISIKLKALAMTLKCPVIALSQLSRQVEHREDKRPIMSDLRESGQIEQDADAILFCYREEYYLEQQEPKEIDEKSIWEMDMARAKNIMTVVVGKNRRGGVGNVDVGFEKEFNHAYDLDPYGYSQQEGAF